MLKNHFSKIVIITTAGREVRAKQALTKMQSQGLIESPKDVELTVGVLGSELIAPAWWRAGNGAWGCLQSHIRVLQDAWLEGASEILILEDDVCWIPEAYTILSSIMKQLPSKWGQMYLGGQHTKRPEVFSEHWLVAGSINRTHAYAVNRETIPKLLQHIQHAPDYIHSPWVRHIDHQLEAAHQRGDWNVITPHYWLAGQDENHSGINGRHHQAHWWDWYEKSTDPGTPFVLLRSGDEYKPKTTMIHEGYTQELMNKVRTAMRRFSVYETMQTVRQQAWALRRLPAIRLTDPEMIKLREECWACGLVEFAELTPEYFDEQLKPSRFKYVEPPKEEAKEDAGRVVQDDREGTQGGAS